MRQLGTSLELLPSAFCPPYSYQIETPRGGVHRWEPLLIAELKAEGYDD
jgi:hypothetical protein